MNLSGQMDFGKLQADKQKDAYQQVYNVFDLADEDVHFTKNPLPGHSIPYLCEQSKTQPHSLKTLTINGSDLRYGQQPINSDRIRSSKLLGTIGSKLRRGSNYLVAPKLVGQYLLGITIQSWSEFLNTSRMLKGPSNAHQLTRRVLTNLSYFQGNYLCVSLVLIIYCILTSPLLLLAIIGYVAALYFVTARIATGRYIKIMGYHPNLHQQYSFLTLVSLPLFWIAGAPSALFWVIGASFVVVGLHASMYNSEKLTQELESISDRQYQVHLDNNDASFYANNSENQPRVSILSRPKRETSPGLDCSEKLSSNSNTFSPWALFGNNPKSAMGDTGKTDEKNPHDVKRNSNRIPVVTVISQDFAGLGRVYEV